MAEFIKSDVNSVTYLIKNLPKPTIKVDTWVLE